MAQLLINIGESVNDKRGDPLRTAFDKVNQNFTELFTTDTNTRYHLGDDVQFVDIDPDSGMVVIQSGFDTSMPVYIKGANCSDEGVGGDVYIEAGGAPLPNNGTTGVVGIAGREVTIEVEGGITTFATGPQGVPYVTFPESNGHQIGIQSNEISGLQELILTAADNSLFLSTNPSSENRHWWEFGKDGSLTVPSPATPTMTLTFDAEHYVATGPKPTLTLTGDPWELLGEYVYAQDGQSMLALNNMWPTPVNPGYASGDQFEFDETVHGLAGYVLTITLTNVVQAGPAGWTANVVASEPPAYPSTINSQGAIKLTSNENSLILGTDGGVTISGRLTLLDNPAPGKGIYGTNGLSLYAKNGDQLGLYWNADDATNPYEGIPYHNARVVATVSDWSGYNIEIIDSDAYNKIWTFQPNGVLALPVGGDIVDSNGDSVLGGGSGSTDRLVAGDKSVILDTDGDLTLPTGGEIKSAAGTGDVVIEANNGTARTWTFDGDGTLTLPAATDNANIYRAGSIGIKTDGLSGGQQWTYDDTGKLTFPDTHLTIENSTIGRKAVTIFDDGLTHTEDVEGSRLVFTDTSTSLETYSDPDGPNNTLKARHYTNGGATAGLEVYQEDIAGRTGNKLEVTGGGVAITGGDGVVTSTWNFDIGGELFVPNNIRHQGQESVLNLNANNNGSIYMSPDPTADVNYLLLNASGQIELSTNHNVLVAAAAGPTELSAIYDDAEIIWELVRDQDAAIIAPATRPWAGMPSYLAYIEIMNYPGSPPGVISPGANMAPVAKAASDAYTAWQEELAASVVAITAGSNQWSFTGDGNFLTPQYGNIQAVSSLGINSPTVGVYTSNTWINMDDAGNNITDTIQLLTSRNNGNYKWEFKGDGTTKFPSGAGFGLGDSGQLKVNDSTTLSLDLRDNYGRGFYTNGDGFSLRSDNNSTWKFGTDNILTLADNTSQIFTTATGMTLKTPDTRIRLLATDSATSGSAQLYVKSATQAVEITTAANGSSSKTWTFANDGIVTLPDNTTIGDSAITFPNNSGLGTSNASYDAGLSAWDSIVQYIQGRIDLSLVTAEGWPMYNWRPTGPTAQGYIDFLLNAWNIQNAPPGGAPLLITPAISKSFYDEMRYCLMAIRDNYNLSSTAVSISASYGKHWNFSDAGDMTFPDTTVQVTAFQDVASHLFFVHPNPGRTFTATGTYNSPFGNITAAINAAVTAGHSDSDPAVIILLANITENITLAPGVYLTSLGTGTHGSPTITGTVTITSSTGSTVTNHYSISNLRIVGPTNDKAIYFTGTAPQKLFVRDMWIDAHGTGTGIYMDNTGSGSSLQLDIAHMYHDGSGDIYCIDVVHGGCYVTDIETSGATQVAAVRAGAVLTIDSSELDAVGDVVCETYGTGSVTITNSIINNTQANGNGIKLNDLGGVATLGNNLISVPVGTGYAVQGITGTVLYAANNVFLTANNARSTAIAYVALPTTWSTKS